MKKPKPRPKSHGKKRRNAIPKGMGPHASWGNFLPISDLEAISGDLMVRAALSGASFEEKVLLSGLIPGFLGILRSATKPGDLKAATEKLLAVQDEDEEKEPPTTDEA